MMMTFSSKDDLLVKIRLGLISLVVFFSILVSVAYLRHATQGILLHAAVLFAFSFSVITFTLCVFCKFEYDCRELHDDDYLVDSALLARISLSFMLAKVFFAFGCMRRHKLLTNHWYDWLLVFGVCLATAIMQTVLMIAVQLFKGSRLVFGTFYAVQYPGRNMVLAGLASVLMAAPTLILIIF